jgi:hypothetical protein
VKIVDLNVLAFAVNTSAAQHAAARAWWEAALQGNETVGLPWVVVLGFLRLATSPRVFPVPIPLDEALAKIDHWLAQPPVRLIYETQEHWRVLRALLEQTGAAGNLTTDAHLAALAIEHGATLVSCDTDFARFTKLRWESPLAVH